MLGNASVGRVDSEGELKGEKANYPQTVQEEPLCVIFKGKMARREINIAFTFC